MRGQFYLPVGLNLRFFRTLSTSRTTWLRNGRVFDIAASSCDSRWRSSVWVLLLLLNVVHASYELGRKIWSNVHLHGVKSLNIAKDIKLPSQLVNHVDLVLLLLQDLGPHWICHGLLYLIFSFTSHTAWRFGLDFDLKVVYFGVKAFKHVLEMSHLRHHLYLLLLNEIHLLIKHFEVSFLLIFDLTSS